MALDADALLSTMSHAAADAFGQVWKDVKNYTIPELRKLAGTFVDIELGLAAQPPYYTRESANILFRMQVRATRVDPDRDDRAHDDGRGEGAEPDPRHGARGDQSGGEVRAGVIRTRRDR